MLGSFSGIVLNAATTLFICFVADRDAQTHGSAYGGGTHEIVLAQHVQVVHGSFLETHQVKCFISAMISAVRLNRNSDSVQ